MISDTSKCIGVSTAETLPIPYPAWAMEDSPSPCKPHTAHAKSWQLVVNSSKKSMISFQWVWLVASTLQRNVHKQICEQEETKKAEFRLFTSFLLEVCSCYFLGHSGVWSVFQLFFETLSSPSKPVEKLTLTQKLIFFFLFFLKKKPQISYTNALSEWTASPISSETLC